MRSELRLPRPRICVLLVLAFLGFGVLLGHVAGSPVRDTLDASARPQLKVVMPAAATSTSPSSSTAPRTATTTEPPEVESTPTPTSTTPTTTTPAKKKTAAKPAAGESESGGGEGKTGSAGNTKGSSGSSGAPATKLPAIKHVFVIMLSDEPYAAVFGPESKLGYVTHTLEPRGELLVRYDAVAHEDLANEVALVSGQGPTEETAVNCPTYTDIAPATVAADEQVLGNGCIYPHATQTLAGELTAKHLTWRAYVQGTGEGGASPAPCTHPAVGAADPTSTLGGGAFATYLDPFLYFQSTLGSPTCAAEDAGLARLKSDLASPATTPNFSYIAPDRCRDANPAPCAAGEAAGVESAALFLQDTVSEITASKAYKQSGLIVITSDEAPSSGEFGDSSSCCGQPRFPNLAAASKSPTPRGGGAVGALLLSPFVKGATTSQEQFNHFSLLRTIEDFFGVKHLGYADLPSVKSFEAGMFLASAKG